MRLAAARENNQHEGLLGFLAICSGRGGSIGVNPVSAEYRPIDLLAFLKQGHRFESYCLRHLCIRESE